MKIFYTFRQPISNGSKEDEANTKDEEFTIQYKDKMYYKNTVDINDKEKRIGACSCTDTLDSTNGYLT